MGEMRKFPSIEQFKNTIHKVRQRARYRGKDENGDPIYTDESFTMPVLKFRGFIKLHGSNAAIVEEGGERQFQSRENILSLENTLNGFYTTMHQEKDAVDTMLGTIRDVFGKEETYLSVYGEWCGGSIQKGVALSQLSKRFVVFAIKRDDVWVDIERLKGHAAFTGPVIHLVANYASWLVEIDFGSPENVQNVLVDITNKVEAQCPYGFAHGADGIGEGVVWQPLDPAYGSDYWFKVKGEAHSVSKVKSLAPVDLEKIANIREAGEKFATANRIDQGISVLRENGIDMTQNKAVADLIQWVMRDILKEEHDDLVAAGLDGKAINGEVAKRVRNHFFGKFA